MESVWKWTRADWPSRIQRNEPGIVGAWDFGQADNRTVEDRSINANDATLAGGVDLVNTPSGRACRFDGANGYAELGNDPILCPADEATVIAWVRNHKINLELVNYRKNDGPTYYGLWQLRYTQASVNIDDGSAKGSDVAAYYPSAPEIGGWIQVGFIFSRSAQTLIAFSDAQLSSPVSIGGDFPLNCGSASNDALYAGCAKPGTRHAWLDIARLYIFNRALSADELSAEYNNFIKTITYRDNFDYCPVTLATVGGAIGGEVSRSGWQCADTVGRWDIVDADSPRGRVISCSVGGKLLLPLQGAGNFATKVFDYTGTASLAKLAHALEITASAGATIRQVEMTLA